MNNSDSDKIINGDNYNQVLDYNAEEVEDVIHIYGPDTRNIQIFDESKNVLKLSELNINFEPCYEVLSKEFLIEKINDVIKNNKNSAEIAEQILKTGLFGSNANSQKNRLLIQMRSEKGYWGEFKFNEDIKKEQVYLLSIEMEGMEHVTPNILTGLLIKKNKCFSFKEIDLDEITTQTKSTELYIHDKFNGIIWEG